MEEETKFHWAEGMKYALEGIKTLFLLNGAATVSILTFIGNTKDNSDQLIYSMICFAFGAATGPVSLFLAYLAQLKYGNAAMNYSDSDIGWSEASKLHNWTYVSIGVGLFLFLLGVILAGCSLKQTAG